MANVSYQYGRLIDQVDLIVPDNQSAHVALSLENIPFIFEFIFFPHDDPTNPTNKVSWHGLPNGVTRFSFFNWNFQLGATTAEPVKIGELPSGSPILVSIYHSKVNNSTNVCKIQFLLGAPRSQS